MKNYWAIAPYERKSERIFDSVWEYDLSNGTIAIGWDALGNVFRSKLSEDEFKRKFIEVYGKDIPNDRKGFWYFWNEISIGDIIIARKGRKKIVGIGEAIGKPFYDKNKGKERATNSNSSPFPNFINVRWEKKEIEFAEIVFPQFTVCKITKEKEKYKSLITIIKGGIHKQRELEDYPDLKNTKPEFINLEINNAKGSKRRKRTLSKTETIDFEKENKENKRLGERGEIIVLDAEINYLKQEGKHNLADKVKQISKENVSAGYDIISFEPVGHKRYIEVKSTNSSPSNKVKFLITSNEYKKRKELKNYYIYIVFNAKSEKPKIWPLKAPFSFEGKGLSLTPISYRVEISTIGMNELT